MHDPVSTLQPGDPAPIPPEPCDEAILTASWQGERPRVSVICHTYNHAAYIRDALHGILLQRTPFPFELIVHDDASSDGTREIVQHYAERYPRILRPILQDSNQFRQGRRAHQFSFTQARGEYIALCDGDDFWMDPAKLARQVAFLDQNPDYVITYANSLAFFDHHILEKDYKGARRDLSASELQHAPSIFTLTACFRNVVDVPPETCIVKYADLFLWSRLGLHGKGKYLDDIIPSLYRVHDGGIHSRASAENCYKMDLQTYSGIFSYYQRKGNRELEAYFLDKLIDRVLDENRIRRSRSPWRRLKKHWRRLG